MPRTTRKKKKPQFEKRVELTDSDGWTHVTRGSKREPPDVEQRRFKELTSGLGSLQTLDMTMEVLLALYRQVSDAWRASQCCQELMSVLQEKVLTLDAMVIDRCLCTGLGSVSNGGPHVSRAKSMWQLAAFETIIELLKSKHEIEAVYVQDPRFSDLDKDFLTSERGFTVLHDPGADQHMSTTTFLFAPCNEFVLLQRAFEVALPALFLGNNIGDYLLYASLQIKTPSSLERFLSGSEVHDVKHQQKLPLSSPLQLGTLYWRSFETRSSGFSSSPNLEPSQIPETQEASPNSEASPSLDSAA